MSEGEQPGIAPTHPDLLRLLDYWHRKRGSRAFPRRADIDPLDLGFMLPRIALTEVHEGEAHDDLRRYRLRVVVSWWAALVGFESIGMWLDDWPHANQRELTADTYEQIIAAAPALRRARRLGRRQEAELRDPAPAALRRRHSHLDDRDGDRAKLASYLLLLPFLSSRLALRLAGMTEEGMGRC